MKKQLTGKIIEIEKSVKYKLIVNMGRDEETKSYPRKSRIFYGTKREAEAYLRDWIYVLENPEEEKSTETVGEWLDFWLENDVPVLLEWEQNTTRRAKGIIKHNLKPNIGDIILADLTAGDILNMYKKLSVDGGRYEKGLSKRSIRYVHTVLNQSLNQAVVRGKIEENPAKGLTPANKKGKPQDSWVVMNGKELVQFLQDIKDHIDYSLIFVDSYTGLRQSEILGLTWEKILWEKFIICVIQALHKTYEEEVEAKENEIEEGFELRPRTKNETSTREVDVSQRVIEVLKAHKKAQEDKGINTEPGALVFTEPDGSPLDANNFAGRFRRLATRHGHKGMTFHHLRHTHATILLSDGAYINEVSERLGHADSKITFSVYGHVLPKNRRRLADRFDELVSQDTQE